MNRKLLWGIPAVIISALLVTVIIINADTLFGSEEEIEIIGFDHQKAGNHVRELVKNGPRMSGSEEELLGAQYIASQFEDAGLSDVHIEDYPVTMFEINTAEVSMVEYGPLGRVPNPMGDMVEYEHITDFVLQGYSGSLNWNNFRDDLWVVNIGNGTDLDSYSQAAGRVCLVEQTADTPANKDLYFYAYEAGARAIILQNCWRGEDIGYLPMFKTNQNPIEYDDYPDIPFFMVSKAAGDDILSRSSSHKMRLNFDVEIGPFDIRVVVGDLPAEDGSNDDMIVFTAHHDTCYNTMGAIDNTVGPASLIETARALSGYELDRTIRFCTFGGEEEGLFGSTEYYNAHREELSRDVDVVINFDMAHADTESMRLPMSCSDNNTIDKINDITDRLMEVEPSLEKYEVSISHSSMNIPYSDYYPFVMGGATGIAAWGSGCAEYHTYMDNLDHLNPESLQVEGRILGSYALMLAT